MHYVMGDIHGNMRRFLSVLKQIDLKPEDRLYVLGDVVDRHPDGIRILQRLMAMPNAQMILGNHEYMLLRALGTPYDTNTDDGTALAHWYRNGGKVTHDHLKRLRKSLRRKITDYLLALPLCLDVNVNGTAYKLVHGAPIEDFDYDPKYHNPVHFAVWKRLSGQEIFPGGATLIFGHTPTEQYQQADPMEIWHGPGMIGIDCGCGYPEGSGGRLACLRLEDGKVFYSE